MLDYVHVINFRIIIIIIANQRTARQSYGEGTCLCEYYVSGHWSVCSRTVVSWLLTCWLPTRYTVQLL